ncbi:MAG: heme exporter protein CcmD [Rubrivivax sp.]|nr:MAG: heme exporter protein CcmD [Rubrivivax sp.]
MSWGSWSEFWAMGGYALYVWGSMGAVVAVILAELAGLLWQRKAVIANVVQGRQQRQSERQRPGATMRSHVR